MVLVAGINVGGLESAQATQVLTHELILPTLNFSWGTSTWPIPTSDFDLQYNPQGTVQNAYLVGRSKTPFENLKNQVQTWQTGTKISPLYTVDENKIVASLAPIISQINIPVNEPEIQIISGKIIVSSGENGQAVDERALIERIKLALSNIDTSPIEIPVRHIEPKLSDSQIQTLTTKAQSLLGKKIILKLDSQTWELTESQVISWIDPSASTEQALAWKKPEITIWVQELAENINRPAENAHFRYLGSGKVEEFSPAKEGLLVSENDLVNETIAHLTKLESDPGPLSLAIPVAKTAPAVSTDQVNNLGIKELVARGDSDYSGSIPNRIFNLHKAANSMNGVLIAPGEDFSFNKYVGDISAAGGYKQAYVIKQGRTVLGDGGGVCQVSSTMFRAALKAGLPIVSRTAHAYRVHYYENNSEPGFDATIFTPSVDFKFKNDTPGYLLIQTVFDDAHNKLSFELYGTKDNREISISKARVWGIAPPPPALYQDDPTLPAGVVQQVDFPSWGAKVAFDYKVTRDGQTLQEQTFYSNYAPWQAVYLKGTKI